MGNNKEYERYKMLKNELDIVYRGISINRVLALQCWFWANENKFDFGQIKSFLKAYDFHFLTNLQEGGSLIYTNIGGRKDHEQTFLNIASRINDCYQVINKSSCLEWAFVFNLITIAKAIWLVYKNVKSQSFSKRIYIAGRVCMIMNTINLLRRLNLPEQKRLVCYSVVHETENLLGQFFKQRGTEVFGLTHGAQIVYKKNIPLDVLNYENLEENCLVWSQMTKDEYVKYGIDENKLFIAGYPKNIVVTPVSQNNQMRRCLVLLCRKTYDASNIRLLEMLEKFANEFKFSVKLHPSCDYNFYKEVCDSKGYFIIPKEILLTDCMDNSKYDFAVAVNTTSYYEIQAAGIPCLRFDDGDVYDLPRGIDNDRVATEDEFNEAVHWLKGKIKSDEIDTIINNNLNHNLGVGIDNYREILKP